MTTSTSTSTTDTTTAFASPCITGAGTFLTKRSLLASCSATRPVRVRPLRMTTASGGRGRVKLFGLVPLPFRKKQETEDATKASTAHTPNETLKPVLKWDGLRRIVRVSAVALSVMMCSARGVEANTDSQVHVPRDSASDVEAAALTLGAVTVGGLVMRAVLASRRDEDKEREKLAAECARLEQEEILRTRRLQRKAMERVEEDEELPEDDALQSSLLKRLNDMKNSDTQDGDVAKDDGQGGIVAEKPNDNPNKFTRNTPIPDRGTGSMLLERPDANGGADEDENKAKGGSGSNQDAVVNSGDLEMLERMFKKSSDDDSNRKSK